MAGITIKGLSKHFGARDADVAAVSDLDLDINDNQFVTLLGPSGCGKTTTLRLIAGYIVPDAGTIHVDGRLVSSPGHVVPPDARRMGMVFQNYAVWPHKTVFENVVFGLKIRKVPAAQARRKVEETLALVNLAALEQRYPNELSGGQQQRVALARSLVVEPEILLLDEPLSNLDANLREEMRFEIRRLHEAFGITTLYVTHDQAEAMVISDRVAVLEQGRLAQVGVPEDLFRRPQSRFVAEFIGKTNIVEATATGADTVARGTWRLRVGDKNLTPGAAALVSIRPHEIRLAAPAGSARGDNVFAGTVRRASYLGAAVEYQVTVDGADVTLRVTAPVAPRFSGGDAVILAVDPASCVALRR
ncbi:MAG: ABC transporter ATP-binding protein [Xanthobacteraceae bacterium]